MIFDSNMLATCILNECVMVEVATNPFGYRVHAGEVFNHYAPDKNQATPAQYHISDHNIHRDI
jgi:hypothetical protein